MADDRVGDLLIPAPGDLSGKAGQQLRRGHVLLLHGKELRIHDATGHDVARDRDHVVEPPVERTRGHGHLAQATRRVRDVLPSGSKVLGPYLVRGYAGHGTGDQTGARITGVPVEDLRTRYALVAEPGDPIALRPQVGRFRSGYARGVPGGVRTAKDGGS